MENPKLVVNIVRLDPKYFQKSLAVKDTLQDTLRVETTGPQTSTAAGKEHTCARCRKVYKNASTLRAHNLLKHPDNEAGGTCTACDKWYPSILSLQKHLRYKHRYDHRCIVCYRAFPTAEMLTTHGQDCKISETPCATCGKIYDSQIALRNHIKYKHPEERSYGCDLCRRVFTTNTKLDNHKATIHPPGMTSCAWCGHVFKSITALQSHILYKHTEDCARCVHCHKVFRKKIRLQRHLTRNHQWLGINVTVKSDDSSLTSS